jgi:hypothetical protein
MKFEFSRQVLEKKRTQISSLVKIRILGAELFHANRQKNGRTDMSRLIITFRNFANAPKNVSLAVAHQCHGAAGGGDKWPRASLALQFAAPLAAW